MIKLNKKTILILLIVFLGLVLFAVFLFLQRRISKIPITFITSTPVDGAVSVSLFDPISAEFSNVDAAAQDKISYQLDPDNKTESLWKNNQVLTITPIYGLDPNTKHSLSFYYQTTLIKTISFSTKTLQELSQSEQEYLQTLYDFQYSQSQKAVYAEKPWLKNLPIDNAQYEAVYDPTKDDILVRIRDKTTNLDTLKNQIRTKLVSIGVPQDYKIDWILP